VWASPDTQVAVVAKDKLVVTTDRTALKLVPPTEAPDGIRIFLGIDREAGAGQTADGRAVFAVLVQGEPDDSYAGLREIGGILDDREAGIAVNVVGLSNWHGVHTHCANCGEHTVVVEAGHVRECPACGAHHFPRSDPAIIVLVTDDQDRHCSVATRTGRPDASPLSPASWSPANPWRPPYAAKSSRKVVSSSGTTCTTRAASPGPSRRA